MALCPDHGGYTGDSCKKCQEPRNPECQLCFEEEGSYACVRAAHKPNMIMGGITASPTNLEASPGTINGVNRVLVAVPSIDPDDQLALYRLERDITVNQQKAQTAQAQFQNFLRAMFEKYGVKPAEYTLDMEKMEFTLRETK